MQGPKDMFYKVVAHVDFFFFFLRYCRFAKLFKIPLKALLHAGIFTYSG